MAISHCSNGQCECHFKESANHHLQLTFADNNCHILKRHKHKVFYSPVCQPLPGLQLVLSLPNTTSCLSITLNFMVKNEYRKQTTQDVFQIFENVSCAGI